MPARIRSTTAAAPPTGPAGPLPARRPERPPITSHHRVGQDRRTPTAGDQAAGPALDRTSPGCPECGRPPGPDRKRGFSYGFRPGRAAALDGELPANRVSNACSTSRRVSGSVFSRSTRRRTTSTCSGGAKRANTSPARSGGKWESTRAIVCGRSPPSSCDSFSSSASRRKPNGGASSADCLLPHPDNLSAPRRWLKSCGR